MRTSTFFSWRALPAVKMNGTPAQRGLRTGGVSRRRRRRVDGARAAPNSLVDKDAVAYVSTNSLHAANVSVVVFLFVMEESSA